VTSDAWTTSADRSTSQGKKLADPSHSTANRLRGALVWGTCALLAAAVVLYIIEYAHNIPYYDEWSIVDVLSGARPLDGDWLWQPRNDHRIPIPKLILLVLYHVSGWDFRVGMFANAVLLAAIAGAGIWVAVKRRRRRSYADAFLPLLLLGGAHYENLLWSWQLTQVIPVVIALGLLLTIVRFGTQLAGWASICCGLAVASLPLCGVPGLAYVPGFALWLTAVGRQRWQSGLRNGPQQALIVWALATVSVFLTPIYFMNLETSVSAPFQLLRVSKAMVAFVAQGLGPAALALQPWSYAFVLGVFPFAVAVLVPALQDRDVSTRSRGLAMLMFLVAFSGLAFAVGVARPGATFPPRYFLSAVPVWWWAYFVFDIYCRGWTRRMALVGLLSLAVAASGFGFRVGLEYAEDRDARLTAFESDLQTGMPPSQLVARHQRTLYPFPEDGGSYLHDVLTARLSELRKRGIGAFVALGPEGRFRDVPLSEIARLIDSSRTSEGLTQTWTFTQDSFVHGMRITTPATRDGSSNTAAPRTEISWARNSQEGFSKDRRYVHWWLPQERDAAFWVYDSIHQVRITLDDASSVYGAPQIRLLTPEKN
jgi:hypothetical protein